MHAGQLRYHVSSMFCAHAVCWGHVPAQWVCPARRQQLLVPPATSGPAALIAIEGSGAVQSSWRGVIFISSGGRLCVGARLRIAVVVLSFNTDR